MNGLFASRHHHEQVEEVGMERFTIMKKIRTRTDKNNNHQWCCWGRTSVTCVIWFYWYWLMLEGLRGSPSVINLCVETIIHIRHIMDLNLRIQVIVMIMMWVCIKNYYKIFLRVDAFRSSFIIKFSLINFSIHIVI